MNTRTHTQVFWKLLVLSVLFNCKYMQVNTMKNHNFPWKTNLWYHHESENPMPEKNGIVDTFCTQDDAAPWNGMAAIHGSIPWNHPFKCPKISATFQYSGQIIIFHQPRFPWNKGISLTKLHFGVRSCEVAIIWPEYYWNKWRLFQSDFFFAVHPGTRKKKKNIHDFEKKLKWPAMAKFFWFWILFLQQWWTQKNDHFGD